MIVALRIRAIALLSKSYLVLAIELGACSLFAVYFDSVHKLCLRCHHRVTVLIWKKLFAIQPRVSVYVIGTVLLIHV